ncbi:methyltransferase domain-containing protein [Microaerobacter geothermalis]|uniref:class I SAM-dependent methyltransferase n=1 Tax=Microaerobacter geothermalis TaxID=674972 RepID=UPI001F2F9BD1|nr:class I SAM-dependent methyltransferase [Microaerobacter geothermalis]MCF6093656.1 methyltransferase domain-containing protein [Microaerobacter geothermalis]
MPLPSILGFAKTLVTERVNPGDMVIDATVGNGLDTLFLAQLVGKTGRVYGFDIQEEAIRNTKERLVSAQCLDQVTLFHRGHQKMIDSIPDIHHGKIQAVMFNLGYLPKGDKTIITQPETTLEALKQSLQLLVPRGLVSVILYPGHEGGKTESDSVLQWASSLEQKEYHVMWYQFLNQKNNPPTLLAVEKHQ